MEWMTDTSAAAAQKRAKEQLTAAMASMVTQGNIEAEQAAARKREEKRRAEEDSARKVRSFCGFLQSLGWPLIRFVDVHRHLHHATPEACTENEAASRKHSYAIRAQLGACKVVIYDVA